MEPVDPERERMRLLEIYSDMADEQLDELAAEWDSLTEPARASLTQEVERRGLHIEFEEGHTAAAPSQAEDYVTIRTFETTMDAIPARGLLESAGITTRLADGLDNPIDPSSPALHVCLRVRAQDAGAAGEILDAPPELPEPGPGE